jgi:predicted nuclease of predicted toxin-antitoxin system
VDESVDRQIVDRLRADGHEVGYVAELAPGVSDDTVLEQAQRTAAVLLTADKDFGELVYRQRRAASGVVLIRLAGLTLNRKAEVVAAVFRDRADELMRSFTVITPGSVKVRRQG